MKAIYHGLEVIIEEFKKNECLVKNDLEDFKVWTDTDNIILIKEETYV